MIRSPIMASRASAAIRVVAVVIAVAVVLAAGLVIGGAPTFFGVTDDPTASITFDDQTGTGENVTIEELETSDGGFVVISNSAGSTLEVSPYLEAGTHENVTIESEDADLVGLLTATVHQDTTDDGSYAYADTDGEEDRPYLAAGYPVSDTATVSPEDDEALGESFRVESMDAPTTANTTETITVNATVTNPMDAADQQYVEFRLNGTVTDRQLVELDAGDTRDVSFEVDLDGHGPGTHPIGVFTLLDGELGELDLAYDAVNAVTFVSATNSSVTVNATLPADGFVAVERADDREQLGTSDRLDVGTNENVTVLIDDAADEDEELYAVLYEGDAADPENATVVESAEGDPVERSFTLGALVEG